MEHLNRRLPLTTHSVIFDIQRWGNLPSVNDLAAWLSSAIAELAAHPGEPCNAPARTYCSRGTEIEFEFLPLPPGFSIADGDATVLSGACTGGEIDTAFRLRKRLKKKASKYPNTPAALPVGRVFAGSGWFWRGAGGGDAIVTIDRYDQRVG